MLLVYESILLFTEFMQGTSSYIKHNNKLYSYPYLSTAYDGTNDKERNVTRVDNYINTFIYEGEI